MSLLGFREKRVLGPNVEESMPGACSRNRWECIVRRWGRGPVGGADRPGAACGPALSTSLRALLSEERAPWAVVRARA